MNARSKRIAWLLAVALSSSALVQGRARASGKGDGDALKLYGQAMRLFSAGRYEPAAALYERALSLSGHPNNLYYLAECQRRLGDLRRSHDSYRRYAATLPPGPRRQSLEEKIARLRVERACRLSVSTTTPGAQVFVDGASVGLTAETSQGDAVLAAEVQGGKHAVTIRAPGRPPLRREIFAEFGEPLAIAFAPPAPPSATLLVERASPAHAALGVDGRRHGRTPRALTLPAGQHTVSLAAAGFAPYRQVVELAAGQRTVMRLRLDPLPARRPPEGPFRAGPGGWSGRRLVLWTTVAAGVLAVGGLASGVAFNAKYNAEPAGSASLETYQAAALSSYVVGGLLATLAGAGLIGLLKYGAGEQGGQRIR